MAPPLIPRVRVRPRGFRWHRALTLPELYGAPSSVAHELRNQCFGASHCLRGQ